MCREIVCGLKLYEDVDEVLFINLVEAIKRVQENGSLVKLSFGGWAEYGNLQVPTKVPSTPQWARKFVKVQAKKKS